MRDSGQEVLGAQEHFQHAAAILDNKHIYKTICSIYHDDICVMNTSKDYHALLTQLFTSDDYLNLLRYYQEPSMLEIFGKTRNEKCHSGFIAWLLGTPRLDFKYDSPLYRFLNLLYIRAHDQGNPIADALSAVLFSSTCSREFLQIRTEVPIYEETYGDGFLDIFIQTRISGRKLNIIIENKVSASETKKRKRKGEDKFQSQGYADWLKKNKDYQEDCNLLVFLSPISTTELDEMNEEQRVERCNCKDFIHINYQDILDKIIQPFIEKSKKSEFQISAKDRLYLEDYKRALGKPTQCERFDAIMAMNEDEKNMLLHFFENNRDLILAALQAKTEDPSIDDDERDALKNLKASVQRASRPREHFTVNGIGSYTMFEATKTFIDRMREKYVISKIQTILKSCGIALLSQDEWEGKTEDTKKRFEQIGIFNSHAYYLTHGYAFNKTKSVKNPNFPQLMKKAKDFEIDIKRIVSPHPAQ